MGAGLIGFGGYMMVQDMKFKGVTGNKVEIPVELIIIARYYLTPEADIQKVVDLPPNLKFIVSPFLILTQCKISEKTAGQCSAYHLSV